MFASLLQQFVFYSADTRAKNYPQGEAGRLAFWGTPSYEKWTQKSYSGAGATLNPTMKLASGQG